MEAEYRLISLKLRNTDYTLNLKLSSSIEESSKMTALLYVKEFLMQKIKADDVKFYYDEFNPTNEEEIL